MSLRPKAPRISKKAPRANFTSAASLRRVRPAHVARVNRRQLRSQMRPDGMVAPKAIRPLSAVMRGGRSSKQNYGQNAVGVSPFGLAKRVTGTNMSQQMPGMNMQSATIAGGDSEINDSIQSQRLKIRKIAKRSVRRRGL